MRNRTEPLPAITSAGQPDREDLQQLAAQGYVAVIDLCGAAEDRGFEEQPIVEALGMRYISLPIAGPDALSFENALTLDRILGEVGGPVLIHCASGNRVGGLLALREGLNGASTADAIALGRSGGMGAGAQARVEQQLQQRSKEHPKRG